MKNNPWQWTLVVVLGVTWASGCGGGSDDGGTSDQGLSPQQVQQLCNSMADAECEKVYECLSSDELAIFGLPATVAACKSEYRSDLGCDAWESESDICSGNKTFHREELNRCLDQVDRASCSQVRSDTTDYAPACERVCSVE
jgi:hypothetical protein